MNQPLQIRPGQMYQGAKPIRDPEYRRFIKRWKDGYAALTKANPAWPLQPGASTAPTVGPDTSHGFKGEVDG